MELSHEARLIQRMIQRYKRFGKSARPLRHSKGVINVGFSLSLIQILDFDETKQVFTANLWKKFVSRPTFNRIK